MSDECPDPAGKDPVSMDPVEVPHSELNPELLRSVVESFVLREGTDYGLHELSLEAKVLLVIRQLEQGKARIVFDPNQETVDIIVTGQSPGRRTQ